MHKKLLILILVIALAGLAWSQEQELSASTISGGGGRMSDQNYELFDIKCTPFTGMADVFYPPEEVWIPTLEVEEGPVILYIRRAADDHGSDIWITWEVNTADFPNLSADSPVDIYMLAGNSNLPPGQYDSTPAVPPWAKIVNNNSFIGDPRDFTFDLAEKKLTFLGQVGVGVRERYFKGLIAASPIADLTYGLPGAVAVGKVNVEIETSYTLVSAPLTPQGGDRKTWTLPAIFGTQIAEGELQYNDKGLLRVVCSGGIWPDKEMEISRGFWLKSGTALTCTLVGKVLNASYERQIIRGYDLYGYPYPINIAVSAGSNTALGIAPEPNDVVQLLVGGGLVRYSYGSSGWGSSFNLGLAKGYWYENPLTTPRYFRVTL